VRTLLTIIVILLALSSKAQLIREVNINGQTVAIPGEKIFERTRAFNTDEFYHVENGVLIIHSVTYTDDAAKMLVKQEIQLADLNFSASEIQNMAKDPVSPFNGVILYIDTTKKYAKKSKGTNYVSLVFASEQAATTALQKFKDESKVKPSKSKK
jgi:hypothetical protein